MNNHNRHNYYKSDDTDNCIASEANIAMNVPFTVDHIVLSIPYGYDIKTLRHKVSTYYSILLKENYSAEEEFRQHLYMWKEETIITSSTALILENRHFKAIVEMGESIVPHIKMELRNEPSFLYKALEQIYGRVLLPPTIENGMASENVKKNTELWLKELK